MTSETKSDRTSQGPGSWLDSLTALVFVATLIWQWPIFDRWLALLDEGYVLGIADQINQGRVLYRDVTIDAPLPGSFHLLAWWFQWVGTSVLSSRILTMFGFAAVVSALFRIARSLTSTGWAIALVGVLWSYRIWAFPHWQFYGYALMAATLATISFALVVRSGANRTGSLLLAGIVAGAAILCKQDYGGATSLTTGLALLLLPWLHPDAPRGLVARLRPAALFSIGAFGLILPTLAWYGMHGALDELYYQTVVFPFQVLGNIPHTTLPAPWPLLGQDAAIRAGIGNYFPSILATLWWNECADCLISGLGTGPLYRDTWFWDALLKILFWLPIVLPVALLLAWTPIIYTDLRARRMSNHTVARVLTISFAFGFLLAFNPPRDWVHLMMVYPATVLLPGAALSFSLAQRLSRSARSIFIGILGLATASLLLLSGALMVDLRGTMDHYLPSERGGIYADRQNGPVLEETLSWIEQHVPEEAILPVFPTQPTIGFLAGRPPAGGFFIIWPGQAEGRDARVLADLDETIPHIIFSLSQWGHLPPFAENAPVLFDTLVADWEIEKVFSPDPKGPIVLALSRETETPAHRARQPLAPPAGTRQQSWPFREVWTHPSGASRSEIPVSITVPTGHPLLRTAIGMNPDQWFGPPSAPATFEILQRIDSGNGPPTERILFQQTIEPRRTLDDRQWQPAALDLREASGTTLNLIFRISTNAPEQQSLWGWSVPELETDAR
ncbi:MAG: hypothetical protein P8K76_08125 [Candidatus Binatia bacterium]|nr:hypothetical protein [Candidatus Binatia bacterium]MDG2009731.1 hypothetical protein [Candidatus Binatia bacterium]